MPSTTFAHISHVPISWHSRWPTKCVGILLNILPSIPQCTTFEKKKNILSFCIKTFSYTCDSYDFRALKFNSTYFYCSGISWIWKEIFYIIILHQNLYRHFLYDMKQQVSRLLKVQHSCTWRLRHVCLWTDPI
jgi:hypothetical protein